MQFSMGSFVIGKLVRRLYKPKTNESGVDRHGDQ